MRFFELDAAKTKIKSTPPATFATPATQRIKSSESSGSSNASAAPTAKIAEPAATEPLPNRTEPPAPSSTQPFGQTELDAIRAGSGCWVWSGVLEEWLFWVRDEERRRKAQERGIDAWRIWTLPELTGVVGLEPQDLRNIAAIRRQFNGTMQPGAIPAQWRNALNALEPAVAAEGRA